MNFRNRRQQRVAVLMSLWLCSWIGVTLLHGVTHASHDGRHFNTPCLVCSFLHQPAPAKIHFSLAPRAVPVFELSQEIQAESFEHRAQVFSFAISPRGPPALFFV